jgi:hypothetical protein
MKQEQRFLINLITHNKYLELAPSPWFGGEIKKALLRCFTGALALIENKNCSNFYVEKKPKTPINSSKKCKKNESMTPL